MPDKTSRSERRGRSNSHSRVPEFHGAAGLQHARIATWNEAELVVFRRWEGVSPTDARLHADLGIVCVVRPKMAQPRQPVRRAAKGEPHCKISARKRRLRANGLPMAGVSREGAVLN
jgi:hypothetical protein